MRKLASIQTISEVRPIDGADAIDAYRVNGWWVVGKKGEYVEGDKVVYFEIDSWIPNSIAPFLSKSYEPREYNGVKGERLKTVKLRGQISQGLIMPLSILPDIDSYGFEYWSDDDFYDGHDVTEILGIQKWKPELSPQLSGSIKGSFPSHLVPKTDQERVQNLFNKLSPVEKWEVTLKLDGSSMTILFIDGNVRVCSRNMEIRMEDTENTFVKMALRVKEIVGDKIEGNFAFQGELMGPGVQGNRENFKDHRFFVFDVYDINEQRYLTPMMRQVFVDMLGLDHVPVIENYEPTPMSVEEALKRAEETPSINHKIAEGIVYKSHRDVKGKDIGSFKAISNKFLLKGGN